MMLAVAFMLVSCSGRDGKVIPRSVMTKIYADMFIADQLINADRVARNMADTSFVYEPIFEKYGYTSDDYRASMAYYINDPDRFARILRESAVLIEKDIKELKKEKARLESLEKLQDETEAFRPDRIYYLTSIGNPDVFREDSLMFYVDSAGGQLYFDARAWMDTAYFGPEMVVAVRDTVAVADTLAAVPDTLKASVPVSGIVPVLDRKRADGMISGGSRIKMIE